MKLKHFKADQYGVFVVVVVALSDTLGKHKPMYYALGLI